MSFKFPFLLIFCLVCVCFKIVKIINKINKCKMYKDKVIFMKSMVNTLILILHLLMDTKRHCLA